MGRKAKKGGSFEREICKILSLWWTQENAVPRDDVFWRTAGSGARATTRRKSGKQTFGQCGDIQAVDQAVGQPLLDLISIELKRGYPKASIQDILDKTPTSKTPQLEQFFLQAEADSLAANTVSWALILRRDRHVPVIYIPMVFAKLLPRLVKASKPRAILTFRNENGFWEKVFTTTLDQFFSKTTPDQFTKLHKELLG